MTIEEAEKKILALEAKAKELTNHIQRLEGLTSSLSSRIESIESNGLKSEVGDMKVDIRVQNLQIKRLKREMRWR